MLSKLECLLNDVKGKVFNPDYEMIKKICDSTKDPDISNDDFENQIILTYIFLSDKVANSYEYISTGKIIGLDMLKKMRNLLSEYIQNNNLAEKYQKKVEIFSLGANTVN